MSRREMKPTRNSRSRWGTLATLAAALAVVLFLKGCTLLERNWPGDRNATLRFSHGSHAQYVKDCQDCHYDVVRQDVAATSHTTCAPCHESAADGQPVGKDCLLCHYTLTPGKLRRAERPRYAAANVDHKNHSSLACASCHGSVDKKSLFSKVYYPMMEDCLPCHFPGLSEKTSANCALCHAGLTPRIKPDNHQPPDWKQVHGRWALDNPNLCSRCHEQSKDCQFCHSRERPVSHTAAFRTKTHGFHAETNPISCATCHGQDFCESCHRTTQPRTHTGSFKRRPYLHCAVCHLPLDEGNRCTACHWRQPHQHIVALSPPAALVAAGLISASKPCLPCHPIALRPIKHPYNTVTPFECVQCHHLR